MSADAQAVAVAAAPAQRSSFVRRLVRQRLPFAALLVFLLAVLVAVFATVITPHNPSAQDLSHAFGGPDGSHWLGTDQAGQDNLSRLIAGTRISIFALFEAIVIALALGIPLGLSAGYLGGWWERLVMRVNDLFFSLPAILIVFGVVAVLGVKLSNAMIGLGVVFSTRYIALGRAMVKSAKAEAYVDSARVLGVPGRRIVLRHISPNILRPFIVQTSVLMGAIILVEAELSYLGLSAAPGDPSWGRMLHDAQNFFARDPFLAIPPGLAITILVIALNLAGDGVADALAKKEHGAAPERTRPQRTQVRERPVLADEVAADPDAVLRVESLRVSYPGAGGSRLHVVDGVSLHVRAGEILGVAGESGCGKSMTASAILGLVPPPGRITDGHIWLAGRDLTTLDERELQRVRGKQIGAIFQEPMSALDPAMTIGRQIAEPLRVHEGMTRKQAAARAAELLAMVGVPDPKGRLGDYPHQFSGGMAQRVVIARALACDPAVLLADEPTTALDVTVQGQVLDLIADLQQQLNMAVVFVTHDLGVVADLCDRVAVMYAGQVVETGSCAEVFTRPRHPYTSALLASIPANAAGEGRLPTVPGRVPPPWQWPSSCRFQDRCALVQDGCRTQPVPLLGGEHGVRCLLAEPAGPVGPVGVESVQ
jgi:peptide/nickel transport system permease protein